ncbi:phosphatase PAP2 family protein [Sphingomonas sp. BN140010]|uniref:Phosphatase PAP2 family protein n=1 Tax=Sphingomonas arvum TaxID=2992113 RepID=A0ABT3JD78_9SPHN|nr:phosphatase PAP2 family protein [Sphingomonas sp. BN140010]MCW3796720.1 phosphatase PAP2 family protein [Sphingomonas sp. BN140010]
MPDIPNSLYTFNRGLGPQRQAVACASAWPEGVLFREALLAVRRPSYAAPEASGSTPASIPVATSDAFVDRLRQLTVWLLLASTMAAIALALRFRVPIDPHGTLVIDLLLATLLLVSRIWWLKLSNQRLADASGTFALASLAGMTCGAIAMLELRLGYPIADGMLQSLDHALGVDGLAIIAAELRAGAILTWLMPPAYNYTLQIFFISLVILSLRGDRIEAWRGTFCFMGTLLTTCLIAAFVPAKGLGTWASADLLAQLPPQAMRNFWPHFDEFYLGNHPVLRLQVIDGVISFPSFHSIVGFLVMAAWRNYRWARIAAGAWLAVMLLSIFPGGGHYVVDMLAGLVVWAGWFAASKALQKQMATPQRSGGSISAATENPAGGGIHIDPDHTPVAHELQAVGLTVEFRS